MLWSLVFIVLTLLSKKLWFFMSLESPLSNNVNPKILLTLCNTCNRNSTKSNDFNQLICGWKGLWSWYTFYKGSNPVERKWICSKWFFFMFDLSSSPEGKQLSRWRKRWEGSNVIACFFCCTESRYGTGGSQWTS